MDYLLINRKPQDRGMNGVTMWRLQWFDIWNQQVLDTTVDETYRNFYSAGWYDLVKDPNPWGFYTGLKRTNRVTRQGHGVITADSQPQPVVRVRDYDQVMEIMDLVINPPRLDPALWATT
jgi:hypothetical protein